MSLHPPMEGARLLEWPLQTCRSFSLSAPATPQAPSAPSACASCHQFDAWSRRSQLCDNWSEAADRASDSLRDRRVESELHPELSQIRPTEETHRAASPGRAAKDSAPTSANIQVQLLFSLKKPPNNHKQNRERGAGGWAVPIPVLVLHAGSLGHDASVEPDLIPVLVLRHNPAAHAVLLGRGVTVVRYVIAREQTLALVVELHLVLLPSTCGMFRHGEINEVQVL